VLASHSDDEIRRGCERVLWLHRGAVRALGPAEEVLERYERAAQEETLARTPVGAPREGDADGAHVLGETRFGSQEVRIERVVVGGAPGAESTVDSGGPLVVRTEFRAADGSVEDPLVSLQVRRAADGLVVLDASSRDDGLSLGRGVRTGAAEVAFDRLDLPAGRYEVDVGVYERDWEYAYDYLHGAHVLHVRGPAAGRGALRPPRRWRAG
jgi:lipopolysaccharide transport system ATP-binding protein